MPNNNTQQFKRSERLIELGRILFQSARGFTALELGRKLGCHRSTIYRDIDSLSKLNVPIWECDGRFGMHKDRYITSVRVNLHESLSLYLSARLLASHSDKHNPHVVSALEKLASALPESIRQHITRTAEATHKRRPHREYISVLETFTRAWSERKQVRLMYYNPNTDETTDRVFDPYFIEPSPVGYACYVIGYDHLRHDIREFKIERVQRVTILDSSYEIRDNFDPYDYLTQAWGVMGGDERIVVKLRFSPDVAYRVRESDWPCVDTIDDLPDGGCLMTLTVSHTLEMKPWIRGWGADCEVIEPEELRQVIARDMIAAGRIYEKEKSMESDL